jgi:putative ABC transport system ATP-binding protein
LIGRTVVGSCLDGVDYGRLDEDALTRLRRDKLGFVFQAFHVLPHLTVAQNVALPLWLQGLDAAAGAMRRRGSCWTR